ncbi:SEL1-like repeat protein|uniref:tetratricopeptide repeat protein n=1 Tax=Noviherbaspirillum sp. L7-7A TaxID=2850560 RepID=UPI001C2C0A4D|nr:SEL1-like repeat protein [Noviherbaspirillum sp. L7-7A]MBV0880391.1 SEL1-like repeat protein [Noviherbaspirillum sp. L7-7A]
MRTVSLSTAMTLSDLSESTFRRRIRRGEIRLLPLPGPGGREGIAIDPDAAYMNAAIAIDHWELVKAADRGDATAQTELALILQQHRKFRAAVYWLRLAAKRNDSHALHWLARCHLEGKGVARNEDKGIMLLARSALLGNVISAHQLAALRHGFVQHYSTQASTEPRMDGTRRPAFPPGA